MFNILTRIRNYYLLLILFFLLPTDVTAYDFVVDGIYYAFMYNGKDEVYVTYEKYGYNNFYHGDISIPECVNYNDKTYNVVAIGDNAFSGNSITSITIPNSIVSIGEWAFSATDLTSVVIPSSVNSIAKGAFAGCTILYSISLPDGITEINESTFDGCQILFDINIPNSVTTIGRQAFRECYKLSQIYLPNSISKIGIGAFEECGLTSVVIPNKITKVESGTFYGCESLTSVIFTGSLDSIEEWAFMECSNLVEIEIPKSVKTIGNGAFRQCYSLTEIELPESVKSIGYLAFYRCWNLSFVDSKIKDPFEIEESFEGISSDAVLQIPRGTKSKYQSLSWVNYFSEIIEYATPYSLSITAIGNGSASYDVTTIKNDTSTFTVNEGSSITITFTPDNGYRIKSVKVNNKDITSSVSNNSYTISDISADTTVEVEFESIPHTLSITAIGYGSASYNGTTIINQTRTFTVNEGSSATITFTPDNDYRIKSVKVNSKDVTTSISNNSYTISSISGDTIVEVEFVDIITELANDGINYKVVSGAHQTVNVTGGDYGLTIDVPASFTAKDKEWKVVGVEANILSNPELAAIIWNPEVAFNGKVNNPNLLLYVKDKKYAPDDIQNVVVNGEAEDIVLQDAEDGNNFYCPQEFTAKRISYIHRYSMKTGFKTCQGWETIVLPFDVTTILSATGTEIVPYIAWQQGSSSRPFWLYSLNNNGWKEESGIKANTPYIISMPNNDEYDATYNLSGNIQFTSSNVQVLTSNDLSASKCANKLLIPNYQNKVASQDIYVLNVNSQWNTNTATETEGSAFIRSLRQVRPFEAYMSIEGGAGARRAIPIFDEDTNGIQTIPWSIDRSDDAIYNLNGQRVNSMTRGIYIQNGKKIFKK